MAQVVVVRVTQEIDVGTARRAATSLVQQAGFGQVEAASVTTSVSELAHNLCRHASGGTLTLRLEQGATPPWIEVIAEDQGPGIGDLDKAMTDGYSTIGTMGSGLPGARRLMDEFAIESTPGQGTRVVARKWGRKRP
jgi:serine/threonine-protein kinase RsbT